MDDEVLQPVEAAMVCVARYLCCKELHGLTLDLEQHNLGALCFLNELLDKQTRERIDGVEAFERAWNHCLEEGGLSDLPSPFVDATMAGILALAEDLDEFMNIGDVANELLLATSDSPPSAIEMDHIAPESLLGIFLRRAIVKAAKLSFSGMVRTFESYQAWCGVEAFPLQTKQRIADAEGHALLQTADKLFDNGFVHEAMDAAHKHFDYSTTLHVVLADGGVAPTTLVHSNHEAALLYHASMCIQSGQLDQGVTALEATIKLAQQRSKHDVVAVALLWLHHVLARIAVHTILQEALTHCSPASTSAEPRFIVKRSMQLSTGEVVLMRCLGRAASLGLPDVVALGTLALAKEMVSPCVGLEVCGAGASASVVALTAVRLSWALQAAAELGDVPLTMSFVRSHVATDGNGEDKTISSKTGSKGLDAQGWRTVLPKSILMQQELWTTKGILRLAQASALCYLPVLPNSSVEELALCAVKWARSSLSGAYHHGVIAGLQRLQERLVQTHARLVRDISLVQAEAHFRASLFSQSSAVASVHLEAFENAAEATSTESPVDLIRARLYRAQFLLSSGDCHQEVLRLLAQTERLVDKLRCMELLVELLLVRAEVYMQLHNHRAALEQCRRGFEVARQTSYPLGCMRCLIRMSSMMMKLGKPLNALQSVQAIYGFALAFGELADRATASLTLAVATRATALQVYQIDNRWRSTVLNAVVAARVAISAFVELGNSAITQDARDIEESLVQIYMNRSARSAVPLRKLDHETVMTNEFSVQASYLSI